MNKDTRQNLLRVVPWDSEKGYTSMLRYPKSKCEGVLHVSCFAYGENAFHGKGIYAVDAVTWLSHAHVPFNMKRLDVVPVLAPGSDALSLFGYGSDGAMVDSTILCALVALVRAGPWRQNSGEWHAQAEVQADEALCTRDALLEFHKG